MSTPVRVLVTEGEGKAALAAVRSLGRAGAEVDVVASGRWAISLASRYCHEGFVEPPIRDADAWRAFLHERVRARHYDALLLNGQSSADNVAEHRHLFDPHVRILLSGPEQYRIARDKGLTVGLAERLGVPAPRTIFPADLGALRASLHGPVRDLGYPVVVKGPFGSGSNRVRYAASPEELLERFAEVAHLCETDGSGPPLVQEMIRGEGLFHCGIFRDGRPLAEFQSRRVLEYPASGGPTARGESINDDRLREYARMILAELRWTGPASVEFKRDERSGGALRIMEINPRFWGSLEFGIRCGVDFPRLYLDMSLDRPFEPVLTYQVGRKITLLRERVLLQLSTGTTWPAFLREVLRPDEVDIDWGDLRPTLRELRSTWWDYRELQRAKQASSARAGGEVHNGTGT